MRLRPKDIALAQGTYYGVTALWPLVSRRSFEFITGPKEDWWLVEVVALMILPIAGTLLKAGANDRVTPEIQLLGAGAAGLLASSDVLVTLRRRGRPTYLLDAVASGGLLLAWGAATRSEAGVRSR